MVSNLDPHLEPCPFCGSHLERNDRSSTRYSTLFTHPAQKLRCIGESANIWTANADSVAAWNRRAASAHMPVPGWQTMDSAPKDGRWIIAVCNDRTTVHRVSWGYGREGDLGWRSGDRHFGDGLFAPFGGWIIWPAMLKAAPSPKVEAYMEIGWASGGRVAGGYSSRWLHGRATQLTQSCTDWDETPMPDDAEPIWCDCGLLRGASTAILALLDENERLQKALLPLVHALDEFGDQEAIYEDNECAMGIDSITFGDLRRARKAHRGAE